MRRWGQEKKVYAYHFVTIETIDIDIIEQRNPGQMLIPKSGSIELEGDNIESSSDNWGFLKKMDNVQTLEGTKTPLSSSITNILFKSSG